MGEEAIWEFPSITISTDAGSPAVEKGIARMEIDVMISMITIQGIITLLMAVTPENLPGI
jgi:hypothetical protein